MKSVQQWFDEYGVSHQNPVNKTIHWLCIPLIYFSIVCLLSIPQIVLPMDGGEMHVSLATLAIIGVIVFYVRLSLPVALGMGIFSAMCLYGAIRLGNSDFPLWISALIIFVLAWIGQFIGHRIEGAKPSFLKDIQFLLIGPAWLLAALYRKLGISYT